MLPNHHPVVLAKRAATVDSLSGGRLRLCVGVGWVREEIEACGTPFENRGRRADTTTGADTVTAPTDYLALRDLVHRYAAAVDDRHYDAAAELFTTTAELWCPTRPTCWKRCAPTPAATVWCRR